MLAPHCGRSSSAIRKSTSIMQLSRPLAPDQRTAFLEMLADKLRGRGELGDGELHLICRQLLRERGLFSPPLETESGHRRANVGKYA
jgi:hypothetical protein